MSNYNYGSIRDGASTEDRSFMLAFDKLGPLTRSVINDARVKWGPADLYFGGVVKRGLSDQALADIVRGNDGKMLAKLEIEREAMQGVWQAAKTSTGTAAKTSAPTKRRGRAHRHSSDWVKLAAARAAQTAVPRSDVSRAT